MKKAQLLVGIILSSFLIGCISPSPELIGPDIVLERFYKGLVEGDVVSMRKYSTKSMEREFDRTVDSECGEGTSDSIEKYNKCLLKITKGAKQLKIIKIEQETEDRATISAEAEINGEIEVDQIKLIKKDGVWKVGQ